MAEHDVHHSRLAVGLMSGTSLDGVDAALVRISGPAEKPAVRLLSFVTAPYPPALRLRLLKIAGGVACVAAEISQLNFALGEVFAAAALRVCRQRACLTQTPGVHRLPRSDGISSGAQTFVRGCDGNTRKHFTDR